MAIIHCYACGKRISDKAPSCPHCGEARSSDPGAQAQGQALKRTLLLGRLNNGAMLALVAAGLGFLALWFLSSRPEILSESQPAIRWAAKGLLSLGLTGYIVCRILTVWHKRKGG
ncbi:zinc ribbon domain-containing protein [Gallaecimonas xiamenensis]|uniref:Zinc-ribbon domain-containing protein n=1 Tax=Gallaecimonas xiamenensis 3-C-1 TaxID=745411 RepID=K2JTT2_9GAMM|nr:zinc ribbon domain-containing protein [Gallaecimonas xiamenensis]EKE77927.1 hypothetical protein B3C1_00665 [Gallaecimonas xiamenensis 3-C-1]